MGEVDKIAITGASGWLGRSAIMALRSVYGEKILESVRLFGRDASSIQLVDGLSLPISPYSKLLTEEFSIYIPLAFATREKFHVHGSVRYQEMNLNIIKQDQEFIRANTGLTTILISSGVVNGLSDSQKLDNSYASYAQLKKMQEDVYKEASRNDSRVKICRLYSCTSKDLLKTEGYLFSSIVRSALLDEPIIINSSSRVIRNYVDLRQLFAALIRTRDQCLINSGGPKIEIRDLANLIVQTLNSNSKIQFPPYNSNSPSNHYAAPDESMKKMYDEVGLTEISLEEQILNTSTGISAAKLL
jgi:nucleoside-diphosphate-sugar epimerase